MTSHKERAEKSGKELFLEQAAAYYDDMKAAAENAAYGQMFNRAEAFAVFNGRELVRKSLETIVQEQIDELEKKKETSRCPQCQKKKRHRGYRTKSKMSAVGSVEVKRRYDECVPCRLPQHAADEPLGLEGRYSVGLRRLAVRAGTDGAFADAEENLYEYCGLSLSRETIRELCQQEAPKMAEWHRNSPEVHEEFIAASGVVEVTVDGTSANTTDGWREVKVGLFSKRELGKGVFPDQWDDRKLPRPNVRIAFAAVEKKDRFRRRFRQWIQRLKIDRKTDVSALADGAAWIWDLILLEFGKIRENLDVYHCLEHLSATGKVLYGEGTEESERWRTETTLELLWNGYALIEKRLDGLSREHRKPSERESVRRLRGYLSNHQGRLSYCERLAEGRSIGSGQVEGACKNMIGRRLKQTGARWRLQRLNRMIVLCSVRYSSHWKLYWKNAK
jgi:hypothetical protein